MIASTTESQLRRCLNGVRFPASKQDLIAAAISKRCDEDTVAALGAISAVTYTNVTQVVASASIVDIAGSTGELSPGSVEAGHDQGAAGTHGRGSSAPGGEV